MRMKKAQASAALFGAFGIAVLAFCAPVLSGLDRWGRFDWDLFFFHTGSNYRSVIEFGEWPLWNPWYLGGFPSVGNPQAPFVEPWFLLDILFGPIRAIKFKILGHYGIGLAGMYWCGRELGLSRLAASYAAGTFLFSTWLSLHLYCGHMWVLGFAYVPWTVGLLARSAGRRQWSWSVLAGVVVAWMILEGGGAHVVTLLAIISGLLAACWAAQRRSFRPLAACALMLTCGAGLAAVKALPAWKLLGASPRDTSVGGGVWSNYLRSLLGSGAQTGALNGGGPNAHQDKNGPLARETTGDDAEVVSAPAPARSPRSRWDMPRFAASMLLMREQEGDIRYWPIQSWGWHEYGCYLGPLAVVLLAWSLLVIREAWPWAVLAAFCFLSAAGNFAPFAPWTLMHYLPVMSSMRVPSRFVIPFAFAACLLAGFTLDALRNRLARSDGAVPGRRLIQLLATILVVISLADSWMVGRASLEGVFPILPPSIQPRLPAIATVHNHELLTCLLLANYCAANAYDAIDSPRAGEVIKYPRAAVAREQPEYRGELHFVADDGEFGGPADLALLSWSPCSARVNVDSKTSGYLVLNRNWGAGWTADPPHQAVSYKGLIAARVASGIQTIQFRYRPPAVFQGTILSGLTLAAAVALVVWERRRNRSLPPELPAAAGRLEA